MLSKVGLAVGLALLSTPVAAQVTGVITSTGTTVEFRSPSGGTTVTSYKGEQITDDLGGTQQGSAATYASTSRIGPGVIEFQNGNTAGGDLSIVSSHTIVDISFRNDGPRSIVPTLLSTITAAGLGLSTGYQCLEGLTACAISDNFPDGKRSFDAFSPSTTENDLAGAAFGFRVTGGGELLYQLEGSILLTRDPATGKNVLVSDLRAAAAVLDGFVQVSDPGDMKEFSFGWDATSIEVPFPKSLILAPGQSSTLTYETVVHTFARSSCVDPALEGACLTPYSAFGDPIGRGGTTLPESRMADRSGGLLARGASTLRFDTMLFEYPTFEDGILRFKLVGEPHTAPGGGGAVPEPSTWAMLILGLGLTGSALRRRRALPARA